MTDVAVARRLFYSVGKTNGRWPDFRNCEHGFTMRPEYIGRVRDILGADGETLYIPSVSSYYGTEAAQMCEQPVEWLNAKLQEFGGVTAEA